MTYGDTLNNIRENRLRTETVSGAKIIGNMDIGGECSLKQLFCILECNTGT